MQSKLQMYLSITRYKCVILMVRVLCFGHKGCKFKSCTRFCIIITNIFSIVLVIFTSTTLLYFYILRKINVYANMSNLFILNETFTNGLNHGLLNLISLASILCGIFVIISKNPIVSILFLIGLFLNIAGYLMMLGINFIGLSYLLVYVGAVSILFLFIMMLINVRISELTTDNSNSIPLAILIGIFFNIAVYKVLPWNGSAASDSYIYDLNKNFTDAMDSNNITYSLKNFVNFNDNSEDVSFVTSQIWDGALAETSHITSIGNILYTSYPMLLIITSIILLLAMVGAIVITIKQTKKEGEEVGNNFLLFNAKILSLWENPSILLILKIVGLVVIFIVDHYMFTSHYLYCAELTQEEVRLINEIAQGEDMCKYFKEQVIGTNDEFKKILAEREWQGADGEREWKERHDEALIAMKETQDNLNTETDTLKINKKKLESGFYSIASSSDPVARH